MGDDLIFAQKFTRTAADGLAILAEMDNPRAPQEASVVIDMMTTVQRGAKRLRARHIYSGAQGVLSALHHDTNDVLEGRIINLGSVVTEYARGLDELLQREDKLPAMAPADNWDAARETLNALLPTATAENADMLSRLMRAPVTLETLRPDLETTDTPSEPVINAEIVPFVRVEREEMPSSENMHTVDTFELPEPATPEMPLPAASVTAADTPQITLDAMMRDVIADALSVARAVERTISLSYDMGERAVSTARADDLRARLGQALSQIIRQSMGDDRVGHIDINLAGETLHIMAGTTAMRVAIEPHIEPTAELKAEPRITAETEDGLRAQLYALMDPIALHETAS